MVWCRCLSRFHILDELRNLGDTIPAILLSSLRFVVVGTLFDPVFDHVVNFGPWNNMLLLQEHFLKILRAFTLSVREDHNVVELLVTCLMILGFLPTIGWHNVRLVVHLEILA